MALGQKDANIWGPQVLVYCSSYYRFFWGSFFDPWPGDLCWGFTKRHFRDYFCFLDVLSDKSFWFCKSKRCIV